MALIALAGCGGGDADGTEAPGTAETTESEAAAPTDEPTEDDAAAGGEATVMLADTSLGNILVDSEGMTLYMFDNDTEGVSACYDQCAEAWPPLLAEGDATIGEGLDDTRITTVPRNDGTMQVKYGDWPLYYWKDDAAPGDVKGQAVNDVWWVLGADGEPIRTAP